jgi:hypothetical protein
MRTICMWFQIPNPPDQRFAASTVQASPAARPSRPADYSRDVSMRFRVYYGL